MTRIFAGLNTRRALASAIAVMGLLSASGDPATAQTTPAARPTIAVLPFANASGDAAQDFFAEGITDEIAVAMTRASGLSVVARSSVFRFKDQPRDIPAI